jgi:hypothetical protein
MKWKTRRKLRILSFDIENRPLSYWVPDRPSAEITAIAAGWVDVKRVECWMLTRKDPHPGRILERFVAMYDQADIVTGHYVLGHDLPIINGALIELGMPQEALAEYFGLTYGKEHMSQPAWRKANRLGEAGAPLTRARVVGDVQQHKALRLALLERGYLRPPARWSS